MPYKAKNEAQLSVIFSRFLIVNHGYHTGLLAHKLGNILERLSEKQIEAPGRHSAELRTSLQQPIEAVAQGFSEFGRSQGQAIGAGLQDQMTAFADKLDQLLGG